MSVESASLQRSRTESHLLEWQHPHHATSPPHGARQLVQYGQSAPPSFLFQGGGQAEGHDTVAFYAPPLHQETLMEVLMAWFHVLHEGLLLGGLPVHMVHPVL